MSKPSLSFDGEFIKDNQEGVKVPFSDLISINFSLNIEGSSIVTLVLKNRFEHFQVVKMLFLRLFIAVGTIPLFLLVAQISVMLSLILFVPLAKKFFSNVWGVIYEQSKKGIRDYEFDDTIQFIELQKQIIATDKGKKLIRRGFFFSESTERLGFVMLPAFVYNSEKARAWLRFMNEVIYPIFVILIPLLFSLADFTKPITKQLYYLTEHDVIFKYTIGALILALYSIYVWWRKFKLVTKIDDLIEWITGEDLDLLQNILKWLRNEVILIVMHIDYLGDRYMVILKSFKHLGQFFILFMKRYGIIKIFNTFSKYYKKTVKAVNPDLVKSLNQVSQDIHENINRIKDEVDEFKEDIKAKKEA